MNKEITVVEVGPRDGFQSVKCAQIPTEQKIEIIDNLVASGVKHMEFTSFVSPKAIPQMADSREVAEYVVQKYPGMDMFALVPNLRGAGTANEVGIKKICYVVSLSKSHNMANINRTHEQSFDAYMEIRDTYPEMEIVLDLATTFGCPFEGKQESAEQVVEFIRTYYDEGLRACCLCDTIGIADPEQVKTIIGLIKNTFEDLKLEVHFHDTRGVGMLNTMSAINAGVTTIQTALGGLGGCPFAPGASGNLSTEDTVWMLNESGYKTGIDFSSLLSVAKKQKDVISGNYSGHHINIEAETPCKAN